MALIIILVELEQASLFAEASQLYSDLKFYFVLQIYWVWVKGYLVWKKYFIYKNDQQAASASSQSLSDKHTKFMWSLEAKNSILPSLKA